MPETFTRVKRIPYVPETVVVSSVWVVGLVGLADTVIAELGRDWYVIEEEAVALLKLSLFVLATDEVVDIPYVSSPLPPSKIQNVDSTKIVSINMVVNISPLMF